jgi:hypothetical protein
MYFEAAAKRIAAVECPLLVRKKREDAVSQVKAAIAAQGWTPRIRTRRMREYVYAARRNGAQIEERYLGALDVFMSDLAARLPGIKLT